MPIPNKRRRESVAESFLNAVRRCEPFAQLNTKLARARSQDEPVLYAQVLPGLDVLLCPVRGAQPPYPEIGADVDRPEDILLAEKALRVTPPTATATR